MTTSRWTRSGTKYPPRCVIHGGGGIGKTTFSAQWPGAVVLRTEDGLGTLDVPTTDIATSWDDVTGALSELFDAPAGTLVVDSLDWLQPIIWAETCRRLNVQSIEDPGYGKGYIAADEVWRELLAGFTALNRRGWAVVLIAHSDVVEYKNPTTESYSRIVLKLHKRAAALVIEWADLVGFAHQEMSVIERKDKKGNRSVGTPNRVLATSPNPAWEAKNRYSLPPLLPLDASVVLPALITGGAVLPTATTTNTITTEAA